MSIVYILVILRYVMLHEGMKTRRNGTFWALKILYRCENVFEFSTFFCCFFFLVNAEQTEPAEN